MSEDPKKILIVEDEPDMYDFLSLFLQDNGYNVTIAINGKQGFEKAKKEQPDLITLDMSMPEESGVQTLRNIQEDPETAAIPVIIITGISKDFKKFIHKRKVVTPPAGYLEKPFEKEELMALVTKLIG
ncbi:MAG: response regulator [Deltaproteobacteria bacterium]|nr:response regulator [Deltaproteobacteria bacterium]